MGCCNIGFISKMLSSFQPPCLHHAFFHLDKQTPIKVSFFFSVKDANMLVFVTPHQFVEGICKKLVGKLRPGTEGISLIKGMEVKMEGPCMISKLITNILGINCCVLMGANIANEASIF